MLINKYILREEEGGGEAATGGGSPESGTVLDGGDSGSGTGAPAAPTDAGEQVLDGGEKGTGAELFAGKYKSVEELEKGYKESVSMTTKNTEKMNEMSEKLKGFSGAPEGDYETPEGEAVYNESAMGAVAEWGKKNGLSQESYGDLVSTVYAAQNAEADKVRTAEMEKLGKDADARIQNTTDSLNAIFGEELAGKFLYIGQDAEGVEALEQLVTRFSDGTVNPDGAGFTGEAKITQQDLDEAMHKKDSSGMMLMQTDNEYAASVYKKMEKFNKQRGM